MIRSSQQRIEEPCNGIPESKGGVAFLVRKGLELDAVSKIRFEVALQLPGKPLAVERCI